MTEPSMSCWPRIATSARFVYSLPHRMLLKIGKNARSCLARVKHWLGHLLRKKASYSCGSSFDAVANAASGMKHRNILPTCRSGTCAISRACGSLSMCRCFSGSLRWQAPAWPSSILGMHVALPAFAYACIDVHETALRVFSNLRPDSKFKLTWAGIRTIVSRDHHKCCRSIANMSQRVVFLC